MATDVPHWARQKLKSALIAEVREHSEIPNSKRLSQRTGVNVRSARRFLRRYDFDREPQSPQLREIVAAVIVSDSEKDICLVRRSGLVSTDPGLWHCVTGYLAFGESPTHQIQTELREELGLIPSHYRQLRHRRFVLSDDTSNLWRVHAFWIATAQREFTLNWENDEYRWLQSEELPRDSVPWLGKLLR